MEFWILKPNKNKSGSCIDLVSLPEFAALDL